MKRFSWNTRTRWNLIFGAVFIAAAIILIILSIFGNRERTKEMINLIPMPKKVVENDSCASYHSIVMPAEITDERIEKALMKLPVSADGAKLTIEISGSGTEEYSLAVGTNDIKLVGGSAAGVFWGIQTLRQLFEYEQIPCCEIEDKPDFAYRGFYHDVTRGKVPTLETMKKLIDDMAYYKINSFQFYVEHTYAFKEYADSIERTGYLSAEEIRELDRYCNENFIELVPSLSTFGHLFELLQKDRYKHLRELPDYDESSEIMWHGRMGHHTIDPTNPESFELIKSLLDQYMPLFSSDKFNICCDETFDLERGRHKGMDTGAMYIDFVKKIADYVSASGKTVVMWGDIAIKYESQLEKLPKDIVFLNWNYNAQPPEENVRILAEHNFTQILCPGTSTWNRLCENTDIEVKNISKMAEYGRKYNALGLLNTNWGDYGNICSIELAMYGMVFGAEQSWNGAAENFDARVNSLLYKSDDGARLLKELSDIHTKIPWFNLVRYAANKKSGIYPNTHAPTKEEIKEVKSRLEKLIPQIENSTITSEIRDEMLIAAEGIEVMAELFAKLAGYDMPRNTDTKVWLEKYSRKWLEKNKPSELSEIQNAFYAMEE